MAQSLEVFKQVGFVQYFHELYVTKHQKLMAAAARKEFLEAGLLAGDTGLESGGGLGLADSLISESFMLFLYVTSLAIVGFLSEIITRWSVSVVSPTVVSVLNYISSL